MTRKVAQPAKITAVVALIVLMVVGAGAFLVENTTQVELDAFGELLDGVESVVLVSPISQENTYDQTPTPRAELVIAQIAYLEAFKEVIQNNIL